MRWQFFFYKDHGICECTVINLPLIVVCSSQRKFLIKGKINVSYVLFTGRTIILSFESFDLQSADSDGNCTGDYVEVSRNTLYQVLGTLFRVLNLYVIQVQMFFENMQITIIQTDFLTFALWIAYIQGQIYLLMNWDIDSSVNF